MWQQVFLKTPPFLKIPRKRPFAMGKSGRAGPGRVSILGQLGLGRLSSGLAANPKGIGIIQPRVARNELPWVERKNGRNPERVESKSQMGRAACVGWIEPFQGSLECWRMTQGSSRTRNPGLNDCHPDGMVQSIQPNRPNSSPRCRGAGNVKMRASQHLGDCRLRLLILEKRSN